MAQSHIITSPYDSSSIEEETPGKSPDTTDNFEVQAVTKSFANSYHLSPEEELHNEKKLFSFLFSRKVDPIPLPEERQSYPLRRVSFFSKLFFLWLWPLIKKGYKRTLYPDDLYYLTDDMKVETLYNTFNTNLNKVVDLRKKKHLQTHETLDDFEWPVWTIPYALYLTFFWEYTMSTIMLALSFLCQSLSPLITKPMINFVEYRYFGLIRTVNKGVGYTIGAVVLILLNGLLLSHFFHFASTCGAKSKAILTKALLIKSFRLSPISRRKFPLSRINALVTTDLARIDLALALQPLVICFPIPLIVGVVLLLVNIGVTSLSGIGLFFLSLIVCVLMTKKLFTTREKVSVFTDKRISLMREVLVNLKMIKFYAWEAAYMLNITKIREEELKHLFTIKLLRNFITAYAITLPLLSSMVSFVTMWAADDMKSPGEVFSSLSLFSILAQAIMLVPIALSTAADAYIGFHRCGAFLSSSESVETAWNELSGLYDYYASQDDSINSEFNFKADEVFEERGANHNAIDIKNACFEWESFEETPDDSSLWDDHKPGEKKKKSIHEDNREIYSVSSNDTMFEKPVSKHHEQFSGLMNLNFSIKNGEFVIVTGSIGSGKSSFLNAIAGFMKICKGSMRVYGDSILCGTPWIQNATIRDNIVFGRQYDEELYEKVVFACCLEDDLDLFPAGDMTEIGERGINISGGQRARINLARAAYSDYPIIILDDVLSAVDSRVGKHIIDHLINGLLKNRTRILATHQLSAIGLANHIIFLNGDGTADFGTVQDLVETNHLFKRLVHFSKENNKAEDDDDNYSDLGAQVDANTSMVGTVRTDKTINRTIMTTDNEMKELGKLIADEERESKGIPWRVYKNYIKLGSGVFQRYSVPIFIALLLVATFVQLFTNTWLSFWMEKKFPDKSDYFYVGFYVAFAFLTVFLTTLEFTHLTYMNNLAAYHLNVKAVARILRVPMSFMDAAPLGRVLNRFSRDTDSLDNELGEQMRLFLFPAALIIGIIILCSTYLPWFLIAVPILVFCFVLFSGIYQGSAREIKRLEAIGRSMVFNNFNETLSGMQAIQTYGAQEIFIKKNDIYIDKMNESYYVSIANQRWLAVMLDLVSGSFALIVCLLCVTGQFNISASSTGLLLNYVIQLVAILSLTVRSMTLSENEMNSAERLYEYGHDLPVEKAYYKTENTPPPSWPPSGYIQINHASLRYRPNLPLVLLDLNLSIYPQEKLGICGRTGAGKSSVMNALYRINELDSGSITIDGLDISELGLYDLRSRLSIIPQDPVLFQGTIRKNLDPFNEYNDDILWDALRRCGVLTERVIDDVRNIQLSGNNNLGNKAIPKFHLDRYVEDEGINFSLGERQLIALARALVRNCKVLILDEATSSVDYETDMKIQETIAREFSNCTILCIAHRLNTILKYDRIIVMDKGRIEQKGTPWSLYSDEAGRFRAMCDKANIFASDFENGKLY